MWLIPAYKANFYSPLPPPDLLRRVATITAAIEESKLGGWITTRTVRYHYIHQFSGTVSTNQFRIQRLNQAGGKGSFLQASSLLQPSLSGQVQAAANGGTLVELRYHASGLWLPGLLVWVLGIVYKLATGRESLGYALVKIIILLVVGWLLRWSFFLTDMRRWRIELTKLLQLTPPPA